MKIFLDIISNRILIISLIGWASAQIIKTVIDLLINKKVSFERLVGSGGMPSSHSSTVCSLATATGLTCGFSSCEFAISAILAIIVMYDARGVRRETGTQAVILNQIMSFLNSEHPEQLKFTQANLKELIGHTPLQVLIGAILGIVVGCICCNFM